MKPIKTKEPLVSVIMPTYNHEIFIGKAIESVLNQTYQNFELIIIDNFSNDNTEGIVASYKDDRVKYIKFRNYGIIAASRNHGIKHAKGEYIAFLDSDDMWLTEKLEKGIKVLESSNDTGMVYTRFRTIEDDTISERIFPKKRTYKDGYIFESLYARPFIACSSVIVKRAAFNNVGLFNVDINMVAIEDTDLWLKIALEYKVKCTDDSPLLLYRIQPQGISHGYLKKMRRSLVIKKRFKNQAGNYLFFKAMLLTLLDISKQELISRLGPHSVS